MPRSRTVDAGSAGSVLVLLVPVWIAGCNPSVSREDPNAQRSAGNRGEDGGRPGRADAANDRDAAGDGGGRDDAAPGACGDGVVNENELCDPMLDACCRADCRAVRERGATCREAVGTCDVAERCDGESAQCPPDGLASAGTACRLAIGHCDVPEQCDGRDARCPHDTVAAAGVVCRESSGACDSVESCDGARGRCPADAFLAQGAVCRAAAGPCDLEEVCTGNAALCPGDRLVPAGAECRPRDGGCDVAESCTGADAACPADGLLAPDTVCRAADGECDLPERCDGAARECPPDAIAPAGSVCREARAACDIAERCDGVGRECPGDAVVPANTVCRPLAGACDVLEHCDGVSDACPPNAVLSAGAQCRGALGACDVNELCTGESATCPEDAFAPAGTQCRAAAAGDHCAAAETCTGSDAACPADTGVPEGTACGAGLACRNGQCCPGATQGTGSAGCVLQDLNGNGRRDENLVFVSSLDYTGALGGLAGGDARCNELAAAANLDRTFSAWLSNDGEQTVNARQRISAGPYARVDGAPIAGSLSELTSGALMNPIELTERGQARSVYVRTGTLAGGYVVPERTCSNWTSEAANAAAIAGSSSETALMWTSFQIDTATCAEPLALYCFQDDCPGLPRVDFLRDPDNCGRCGVFCGEHEVCAGGLCARPLRVFVTSTNYPGDLVGAAQDRGLDASDGQEAADGLCQQHAAAAQLANPERYRAWLSLDGRSAADRIADGVYYAVNDTGTTFDVADDLGHLLDTANRPLHNAIRFNEHAESSLGIRTWTGTWPDGSPADGRTCRNWTSAREDLVAVMGDAFINTAAWTHTEDDRFQVTCANYLPLYCFET